MHRLIIILCLGLLTSCKNNNDNNLSIVGIWKTQSCEIQSGNIWIKGVYEFAPEGEINYERDAYVDSDCVTLIDPSRYIYGFPYSAVYQDLGEATLMEGVDGNRVSIEIIGPTNSRTAAEGFYTISINSLCLSKVFIFDADGYSINEAGEVAIDFDACLVKVPQP